MTTIEVAKAAGVSQATVSRVINGNPHVSPNVAREVKKAMKSIGYVPRPRRKRGSSNQRDVAGRTRTVLVVLLDESCLRRPTLAVAKQNGFMQALAEAGMNVVFVTCVGVDRLPPVLADGNFDAALLWGHHAPDAILQRLQGKPLIWLSSHSEVGHDCVLPGNEAIGRMAANYLIDHRCRRLAFVSAATSHPGQQTRRESFVHTAQLARREVHLLEDDCSTGETYERMNYQLVQDCADRLVDRLLKLDPRPTGVFSLDDALTAAIYRRLAAHGVKLGDDMTFISCNNETPYLASLRPRPATIDLGPEITGRRAVEQLLWRMRHGVDSRRVQVIVEPVLVPGELDLPGSFIASART
jgi:DNA-binding LacI/PurR family transcriptional regulator